MCRALTGNRTPGAKRIRFYKDLHGRSAAPDVFCSTARSSILGGRIDRPVDWASASKLVLSTLLFCALDRGVVRDADDRLVDYGVPLQGKDTTITFRSLGAMTSGYTLKEAAGEAYAYNDYGIQLYEYALSEYVFRQSAEEATAEQFRPMQFEDEWGYYQVPPKRQRIMMSNV